MLTLSPNAACFLGLHLHRALHDLRFVRSWRESCSPSREGFPCAGDLTCLIAVVTDLSIMPLHFIGVVVASRGFGPGHVFGWRLPSSVAASLRATVSLYMYVPEFTGFNVALTLPPFKSVKLWYFIVVSVTRSVACLNAPSTSVADVLIVVKLIMRVVLMMMLIAIMSMCGPAFLVSAARAPVISLPLGASALVESRLTPRLRVAATRRDTDFASGGFSACALLRWDFSAVTRLALNGRMQVRRMRRTMMEMVIQMAPRPIGEDIITHTFLFSSGFGRC